MSEAHLPSEFYSHYETGYEATRLDTGRSRLEHARTIELLKRHVPPPPAVVLDVGGGPGAYALWLAKEGYETHLVDAMPLHVQQAREASAAQPEHELASATVGDARDLGRPDESVDAVLLFGPLYHLTERPDRMIALSESKRVLRPGGLLLAIAISRFASVLDGVIKGYLDDPQFRQIVRRDLEDGQHRNPTNHPDYFTTSFFHHPDELKEEIVEAGFQHQTTLAVEGPGWLLQKFDEVWFDKEKKEQLLDATRSVEEEPALLSVSAHMMAVARKEPAAR